MKNKIFYLGLAALAVFASCDDFLVKEPKLSQTNELTLSTFKGLNDAAGGAYSVLYSVSWYGRYFPVTSDLRGGNAESSPKNSGRFKNEYQFIQNSAVTSPLWSRAYFCISEANNILNAINAGFSEINVSQSQLDNIKAECLFLRALSHFDLVRTYAQPYGSAPNGLGVPIVLVTENTKPTRNTTAEVYAQIVADLLEAESIISDSYVRNGVKDPLASVTKPAIQALLARVYLYMEKYQEAANYATEVISNPKFKMYTAAQYDTYENNGIWGLEVSPSPGEVIFEIYGSENNTIHGNWDNISYILHPDGYGDVGASNDLISLYEETDVRKKLFVESKDEKYAEGIWTNKFCGKAGNIREDNIPLLRLSEMYLIRCEAIFNGAKIAGTTDMKDMNMIRVNRGASPISAVTTNIIMEERRRELCFEGHAGFDYPRMKMSLERNDYNGTLNKSVPFPDNKWAFPIPQYEIDVNGNLEQNAL